MQEHIWVVQERVDGAWRHVASFVSRDSDRFYQDIHYANGNSRIRKFIAA